MNEDILFEGYVEELRFKGIPVDDIPEKRLLDWFEKHKEIVWKDESVKEYLFNSEPMEEEQGFVTVQICNAPPLKTHLQTEIDTLIGELQTVLHRADKLEKSILNLGDLENEYTK